MRRRRPLDWACALGTPFAALGAWAAWTVLVWLVTDRPWQETAGLATLAVVFGGIGTGLIVMSVRSNRDTLQRNRLAAAYPAEPWRWRPEWDLNHLTHTSRRFGTTVLELRTMPGVIGGELAGTITPPFSGRPPDPIACGKDRPPARSSLRRRGRARGSLSRSPPTRPRPTTIIQTVKSSGGCRHRPTCTGARTPRRS